MKKATFTDNGRSSTIADALEAFRVLKNVSPKIHVDEEEGVSDKQVEETPSSVSDEDQDEEHDKSSVSAKHKKTFPQVLMHYLSCKDDDTIASIITWLPSGAAFRITDRKRFEEHVMPLFFNPQTTKHMLYTSFTRKMNRWGFKQIAKGPDAGAFHHKMFLRDEPQLCKNMVCHSRNASSTSAGVHKKRVKREQRHAPVLSHVQGNVNIPPLKLSHQASLLAQSHGLNMAVLAPTRLQHLPTQYGRALPYNHQSMLGLVTPSLSLEQRILADMMHVLSASGQQLLKFGDHATVRQHPSSLLYRNSANYFAHP